MQATTAAPGALGHESGTHAYSYQPARTPSEGTAMDVKSTDIALRNPPNAAIYYTTPGGAQAEALLTQWLTEALGLVKQLFGTEFPGRWYISQTSEDGQPCPSIDNTDLPNLGGLMQGRSSILAYAALVFDHGEHETLEFVRLKFARYGQDRGHLLLHQSIGFTTYDAATVSKATAAVIGMLSTMAATSEPVYGEVCPKWTAHEPSTRLDLLLRRTDTDSTRLATSLLRGYEWATLLNSALAEKLGGPEALRSSGAFDKVIEAGNSLILQATKTPQRFDTAAAQLVWNQLRPVLPAGIPKPIPLMDFNPLIMADAQTAEQIQPERPNASAAPQITDALAEELAQFSAIAVGNGWIFHAESGGDVPVVTGRLFPQTEIGLTKEGQQHLDQILRKHGIEPERPFINPSET